jgi:hypothetical protein
MWGYSVGARKQLASICAHLVASCLGGALTKHVLGHDMVNVSLLIGVQLCLIKVSRQLLNVDSDSCGEISQAKAAKSCSHRMVIVPCNNRGEKQKEGRKEDYTSLQPPGLIGWTGSIQIIKTIHHKMCNTNNVQLPHELLHGHNVCTKQSRISVPNRLQGRALKHKVALIPNNLLNR